MVIDITAAPAHERYPEDGSRVPTLLQFARTRPALALAFVAIALLAAACGTSGGVDSPPATPDDPGVSATEEPVDELDPRINQLSDWSTDFSIHSVPLSDFVTGGPAKDGIRSLESPKFISGDEALAVLDPREPVIAVEINGEVRAYPLGILTHHEIANDVIGGVPVTVTFCPLCNSALVFNRELNGVVYDFGVSGVLRNSDLVMYDRQTETWWQQFTGEAIVGELTGSLLEIVASTTVSWADYVATYPDGLVLSRDTGFDRNYGVNPYVGYDSDENPFLFRGEIDDRLSPIERVVGLDLGDDNVAYPFTLLQEAGVVHDTLGAESIVIFHRFGTASALDSFDIAQARDVGAAGVFRPEADGRPLTFRVEGDNIVDNETGTVWNVLGTALSGPLAGAQLAPVAHGDHFWFAWAAFNPDTRIYEG